MIEFRNNKKKILIFILIFCIILLIMYFKLQSKQFFKEDLIFFKFLNNRNLENNQKETEKIGKQNQYYIEVKKDEQEYKNIDLFQTIDINTLVNQKIAPGTKGDFSVFLISNTNLEYELKIISENEKPKNFVFYIEEDKGNLVANKLKEVKIYWEWLYEISMEDNIQDTKDGINIEKYEFEIFTIGK